MRVFHRRPKLGGTEPKLQVARDQSSGSIYIYIYNIWLAQKRCVVVLSHTTLCGECTTYNCVRALRCNSCVQRLHVIFRGPETSNFSGCEAFFR